MIWKKRNSNHRRSNIFHKQHNLNSSLCFYKYLPSMLYILNCYIRHLIYFCYVLFMGIFHLQEYFNRRKINITYYQQLMLNKLSNFSHMGCSFRLIILFLEIVIFNHLPKNKSTYPARHWHLPFTGVPVGQVSQTN